MKVKLILLLTLFSQFLHAESLDFMRSTGKYNVVVAVILIIFIGIFLFLYRIDNKLTKLEKQINNE
jgi:CcmD family protein